MNSHLSLLPSGCFLQQSLFASCLLEHLSLGRFNEFLPSSAGLSWLYLQQNVLQQASRYSVTALLSCNSWVWGREAVEPLQV